MKKGEIIKWLTNKDRMMQGADKWLHQDVDYVKNGQIVLDKLYDAVDAKIPRADRVLRSFKAQAMGVSLISIGLLSWRTPDIAGQAMNSYGQLYAIIGVLWVLLIGYHAATGQASGPPVYGNLAINAVLAGLFFMYSKK